MSRRCSSSVFSAPGEIESECSAASADGFGPRLGVDSAKLQRASHAIDGDNIRGDSVVDSVRFRVAHNLVEPALHAVLQAVVPFPLAPEKALAVLDPFKVTHRDPACVSENIGNHEDSFFFDDSIGVGGRGTVRTFAQNLAIDAMGILR